MAEAESQSLVQGMTLEGNELESLLKKEFKPKTSNAKEAIENQVRSMSAVRGVKNLTHSLPPGSRLDPQLHRDAQLALALNSNLVGNKIHVYVKNGIIHLTGEVDDVSQKRLAGQIVALGRGSYLIKNRIRINARADS